MEITIEKANGEPMSEKETEALFRFIRRQLKPLFEVEEDDCPFEPDINPPDMEFFVDEDASYVYAAAFCPGISKDRIEVQIDGLELIVSTKQASPDKENEDDSRNHSPWDCTKYISYEGVCELPTEVIAEQATAELSDGVLYVMLPKPEAVKPKTVAVK